MEISIVIAYCIAFEFLAAMIYMHLVSTIPSCEIKSLMPLINIRQALYPSRLSSDFSRVAKLGISSRHPGFLLLWTPGLHTTPQAAAARGPAILSAHIFLWKTNNL